MAEGVSFTSVHLWTPQEHLGIPLRGTGTPSEECFCAAVAFHVFDGDRLRAFLAEEVVGDTGEVHIYPFFGGVFFHGQPERWMFARPELQYVFPEIFEKPHDVSPELKAQSRMFG